MEESCEFASPDILSPKPLNVFRLHVVLQSTRTSLSLSTNYMHFTIDVERLLVQKQAY